MDKYDALLLRIVLRSIDNATDLLGSIEFPDERQRYLADARRHLEQAAAIVEGCCNGRTSAG